MYCHCNPTFYRPSSTADRGLDGLTVPLLTFSTKVNTTNSWTVIVHVSYWQTSETMTNRGRDSERFVRSINMTATLPALKRLAETSQQDWLSTSERRGKNDVNNHIAEHHRPYEPHYLLRLCAKPSQQHRLLSTTDLLSWFTNLEQTPSTSANHYQHHTNDSFMTFKLKTNRTRPINHDQLKPLEFCSQ